MKKSIFTGFVWLITTLAFSQSTYFTTFKYPLNEVCFHITEDSDNNLVGVGVRSIQDSQEETYRGMVWKISSNGDTLSKSFTFGDTSIYFNYVEQIGNSYYIIGTSFLPPAYTSTRLELLVLDNELNLIDKQIILSNSTFVEIDNKIRRLGDNYYLLAWEETDTCNYNLIVKLNANFQLVNSYQISERSYKLMDCLLSPDSSQFWLFTYGYTDLMGPEILCFDLDMNFIEAKNFPYKFWPGTADIEIGYRDNLTVKWFSDTTFIVSCNNFQTFDFWHVEQDYIGISIMDSTLSLVPIQYFGTTDTMDFAGFYTNMDFSNTNNIFFCGFKNVIAMFWPPFPSWIIAGKVNSQLEPEYYKHYGGDAYYFTHSIKSTSDGGSVIIARRYDHLTQGYEWDVSFLKLNSDGVITNTGYLQLNQKDNIWVSPNPASSQIKIESTFERGEFKIFTLQGTSLLSGSFKEHIFNINTTNLPSGLYIIELIDKFGKRVNNKFIKI